MQAIQFEDIRSTRRHLEAYMARSRAICPNWLGAGQAPVEGFLSEDGALSAAVVRARSHEREAAFLRGFCRAVEVVMGGLPLRHQTVIRATCFEGADLPMKEIARTLDVDPKTVEKRKGAALVAFVTGLMGEDRLHMAG